MKLLGEFSNQDKLLGVLKHKSQNLVSTRNPVTWTDRVHRNLEVLVLVYSLLTPHAITSTYICRYMTWWALTFPNRAEMNRSVEMMKLKVDELD